MHDLEDLVPESAGAEAGDDAEIEADIDHGAAERAMAHLALEFLRCGHEEFGIVPAGGAGRVGAGLGVGGPLAAGLGVGWRGRWFVGADAGGWDVDVSAGRGAREQTCAPARRTQDAAVQVGEDGGEVGGAEARRDGGECGGGGALADGGEEWRP